MFQPRLKTNLSHSVFTKRPQDFQGNFHSSEAVLKSDIWLKILPESVHQFRKHFLIKWFRRLTLPSGLWFPCCEICFRWPLASPGASVSPHYVICLAEGAPKSRSGSTAQHLAQGFAEIVAPIQEAFSDAYALSYRGCSKPTQCVF